MIKEKNSIAIQSFGNVWDALADTPAEAENMKIRAAIVSQIVEYIKKRELTQADAARLCQVTQPRMSDLIHGKISKFSLDALVNIAASAGLHIGIDVREEEFA